MLDDWSENELRPASLADAAIPLVVLAPPFCGALTTLGVSTRHYLPYPNFNYASPMLSVLYGFTGFKIERTEPVSTGEVPR